MNEMSLTLDASVLNRATPELIKLNRRTLQEQCVTSMGMFLQDAINWTPFVPTGRMDEELNVDVTPVTKTGKPSLAKKPRYFKVQSKKAAPVQLGVLVVMSKMRPAGLNSLGNPNFNMLTGSRWALPSNILPTGKGSAAARQATIARLLSQMVLTRHSSGHFEQSGFIPARDACVSSRLFKNRYRKRDFPGRANDLNGLSPAQLGSFSMQTMGDEFVAVAENNVGENSNSVLDAKRRRALVEKAGPMLQSAIDKESGVVVGELERRLTDAMMPFQRILG